MTDGPEEQRWQRLEGLWDAATELPSDRWAEFLDTAVSDDVELRRELESMLAERAPAERFFRRMAEAVNAVAPGDGAGADRIIGATVGPYRVEGRLGAGGMGIVYRARDPRLERVVALKLLPSHLSLDERARRRFFTEARAAAAIDHPNICTIYEVGETAEPRPFLAMAFYAGETLEGLLKRGPLQAERAVDLAAQIARGLCAAHERGVTHRDIKPSNVMITTDGVAKILDFGLATLPDAVTTRGDQTLGTVAYMSPERARGLPADYRTDLWSLGVVLYEMVTGTRPFRADSEVGVLYAITHEPHPTVSSVRVEVPAGLEGTIDRLLSKDPADRYPDAATVLEALETCAEPTGGGARRTADRRHRTTRARRHSVYVLAVVAFVAGATALRSILAAGPGPPRVAVIIHDDTPAGDDLGWLPGELAGTTISRLSRVPGIEALSMNDIRPWRDAGLSDRAIADRAGADWLVSVSVRRAGTHVVASVALIDGGEAPLLRREPGRPLGEEGALIEDVARVARTMVREQLLAELQAGRRTWGDTSPAALRLVNEALGWIDEADRRIEGPDATTAWPFLRSAEATLLQAVQADPDWAEPLIRGARLADRTAKYTFGTGQSRDSVEATLERGFQYATRALRLPGDSARALEARGILRYTSTVFLPLDPGGKAATLDSAEQDLRAALRIDRGLPLALSTLGRIESGTGRFAAALITKEDAYRADRYEQPIEKLMDLFDAYFEAGQDGNAAEKCDETANRFPASWVVARCRLKLMAWGATVAADPDSAWWWVRRGTDIAEETVRPGARMQLEILAAGVLARLGMADSGRAVLARVRSSAGPDAPLDTLAGLRLEAGVRLLLGDIGRARAIIDDYLERRPSARNELAGSRVLAGLSDGPTSR